MPLVYVHGVANRIGPDWLEDARLREALFRQFLMAGWRRSDGSPPELFQPYWGGSGAKLAWGGASIPRGSDEFERFGGNGSDAVSEAVSTIAPLVPAETPAKRRLISVARVSFIDAVDVLLEAAARSDPDARTGLAALSEAALSYVAAEPHPPWLADVEDDEGFVRALWAELRVFADKDERRHPDRAADGAPDWEVFGPRSWLQALREGADEVRRTPSQLLARAAVSTFRTHLGRTTAEFLGDVMTYFRRRSEPAGSADGIDGEIAEVLRRAHSLRAPEDPLVVVAHSMGGNVCYDVITGVLAGERLQVDLLVTVGSQVGLFQELDLFGQVPDGVPGSAALRLPCPAAVHRWVNVFDLNDALSFRADPIFEGVCDYEFRSRRAFAHGAYLTSPAFYARLGEICKAGLG